MIITILIGIIILLLLLTTGIFIWSRKKINNVIITTREALNTIQSSVPTLNGTERLNFTEGILNFIDDSINLEIINARRFEIFLDEKNKNLDVDKVIEEVSSTIFNSIKKDIFTDPNLIVSEKYLSSYIQKRTVLMYLTYLRNNVADQL